MLRQRLLCSIAGSFKYLLELFAALLSQGDFVWEVTFANSFEVLVQAVIIFSNFGVLFISNGALARMGYRVSRASSEVILKIWRPILYDDGQGVLLVHQSEEQGLDYSIVWTLVALVAFCLRDLLTWLTPLGITTASPATITIVFARPLALIRVLIIFALIYMRRCIFLLISIGWWLHAWLVSGQLVICCLLPSYE